MKKILTISTLLLFTVAFTYGQAPSGGTFEYWKYNTTGHYYDPDSSIFHTLDTLNTIPTPSGITVYHCDTAHGGFKSARLKT